MIPWLVQFRVGTLVLGIFAAPANSDGRVPQSDKNAMSKNMAKADFAESTLPPRPRATGERCATLKGATGTDFYCASSVLAPQFGSTYGVDNLFSNKIGEAWVEGRLGQGVGEWITIDFKEQRLVKAVIIRNGYQKNSDTFSKNSRVRRLRLVFAKGETQTLTLADSMDLQTIALDPPVSTNWVQFVIDDVYAGTSFSDTALTKLFVTPDPVR